MAIKTYKLGELIEQRNEKYDLTQQLIALGVSSNGFISPKQEDADVSIYNVFYKYDFVFNPARMELNSIMMNKEYDKAICSSLYEIFYIIRQDLVLPEYLNLFIKRKEFARRCWFEAVGSARNYFRVKDLSKLSIQLPDLETQQKYVNVYTSLVENQKTYERGLDDLKLVCDGYIEELKKKYKCEKIETYIYERNLRNSDNKLNNVFGVCKYKTFIPTIANLLGIDLANYKIVQPNWFAYSNRINIGSIALRYDTSCLVSPSYTVFALEETKINPEYFALWLQRDDFLHFAFFYSMGTIKDELDINEIGQMMIPIPPIEIQESIANIYKVYNKRKEINERLKKQIKDICPILIKGSIDEAKKGVR